MRTEILKINGTAPGIDLGLTILHFGHEGSQQRAYVQAGLHADEAPGMICAANLRRELERLEALGQIRGHIVLVPAANPIGLSQIVLGSHLGRFALADGVNFNRDYPDLTDAAAALLVGKLGPDAADNGRLVQVALLAALASCNPKRPADHLKQLLLQQAVMAQTVLDLHCDGEAAMHLYAHTAQAEAFVPLAAWLGAKAMLVSEQSGGHPFDEAVSRPWTELKARFPGFAFPEGAIAATVELRGEADVSHALAAGDARAVLNFLAHRGHLAILPDALPVMLCVPTPLAGSEALEASVAGIIAYHRAVGDVVTAGDVIADIIDPVDGKTVPVWATTSGIFFARTSVRFALPGRKLGKIAGTTPFRTGALLSP